MEAAKGGVAQRHSSTDDRIEYWLNVGWRARNDTEDLARCRLPLQRFLCLVEKPHVLDGNDCLVGEGLEELHLSVAEGSHFSPADRNNPERLARAEQRSTEYRSRTPAPCDGAALRVFAIFRLQVSNLHRPPLEHHTSVVGSAHQGDRELTNRADRDRTRVADQAQNFTVKLVDHRVECIA